MSRTSPRLAAFIAQIDALPRFDASGYDDATGFHGSLRQEPDGVYYLVDDIQRLIQALLKRSTT